MKPLAILFIGACIGVCVYVKVWPSVNEWRIAATESAAKRLNQ